MRQGPARYLIIGNGRLARHLCHYFTLENIPFTRWSRDQGAHLLRPLADESTHILLAISDRAIDDFISVYLSNTDAMAIHFSGTHVSQRAFGTHPLMTFGHNLYDLEKYRQIAFVIDDHAPAFDRLLPLLVNPHARIAPDKKALYHAWCVMAGNFPCMLWQGFFDAFDQNLGLHPDLAAPYLRQQVENVLNDRQNALTGPLVRNDTVTIDKNIAALENTPYADLYRAFVKLYSEVRK